MPSPDVPESDTVQTIPEPRRSRLALGLGAVAAAAVLIISGYALGTITGGGPTDSQTLQERRVEVEDRGVSVMPFDLDRTEHVFVGLPDGGEQTVTALDPADAGQIQLIRDHLQEEVAKFRAGDFADPVAIHGADMPGLAELKDGAGRITVTYTPLEDGAGLRYTTTDPVLVEGIHSWFAAQSMDHG